MRLRAIERARERARQRKRDLKKNGRFRSKSNINKSFHSKYLSAANPSTVSVFESMEMDHGLRELSKSKSKSSNGIVNPHIHPHPHPHALLVDRVSGDPSKMNLTPSDRRNIHHEISIEREKSHTTTTIMHLKAGKGGGAGGGARPTSTLLVDIPSINERKEMNGEGSMYVTDDDDENTETDLDTDDDDSSHRIQMPPRSSDPPVAAERGANTFDHHLDDEEKGIARPIHGTGPLTGKYNVERSKLIDFKII